MVLQLASQSPRRRELLEQIGVTYTTVSVNVPEIHSPGETPEAYVARLAMAKATAGYERSPRALTLGADTIVCVDGDILEKPRDEEDFMAMMTTLSGRSHQVMTAICVVGDGQKAADLSVTEVQFRSIELSAMQAYWLTGEPCDKAGGYAIQGKGAVFVKQIIGSYSGVVGLPIEVLCPLLQSMGLELWSNVL